jgi:hypothetical protein
VVLSTRMKELMLALISLGLIGVAAAPAQDGGRCAARHHNRIPWVIGQTYDDARVKLIAAGWKPFQTNDESSAETNLRSGNGPLFWKEKQYLEVTVCGADFHPGCEFEFVDKHKNELHVDTEGLQIPAEHHFAVVKKVRLVCDD